MSTDETISHGFDNSVDRSFPPVAWLSTGSLGFTIVGGILMASYAPRRAPLSVAVALLVVGVALLAVALVVLAHLRNFAWRTFATVFKWTLLAYLIEAGVIEFAFVRGHTRGSALAVVSAMLVVFAVSVPTTVGFTVARYADPRR